MAKRAELPTRNKRKRVAEGVYLKSSGKYLVTWRRTILEWHRRHARSFPGRMTTHVRRVVNSANHSRTCTSRA